MNTANNQLRQTTDKRLREALLSFMERDKEPTVGELCELAEINRSTFYRHYLDVYDLMEKTERQIQTELVQAMRAGGLQVQIQEIAPSALIPMIETIGKYRHFYKRYLKTHLDVSMEAGMQRVWDIYLKPAFLEHDVTNEVHMLYYYQYFKAGVVSILKLWIDRDCEDAPNEIAEMIVTFTDR